MVNSRVLSDGRRQVTAYTLTKDSAGNQRWLYSDGRRVTVGSDYVTRSNPGRLTITTRSSGLREASLPDGSPAYRETFSTVRDANGEVQKTVVRTVYARVHNGQAWRLERPAAQTYVVSSFRGSTVYVYQPWVAPPGFYDLVLADYSAGLAASVGCPECASPDVQLGDAPRQYNDPTEAVTDRALVDGFSGPSDGVAPPDATVAANVPPVSLGNVAPDPALATLDSDADKLQQQLGNASGQDAELQSQLSNQAADATSSGSQTHTPVRISSKVQDQMRAEAKHTLELDKNGQPLRLADVLASDGAQKYSFQVNEIISTTNQKSGDECVLTSGDIVKFDQLPGDADSVAQMRVVVSKDGGCAAGAVVPVSMDALQGMLNGFNQRLEVAASDVRSKIDTASKT